MKLKRRYIFGGYEGKNKEYDDFVIGYLAENGLYIDIDFNFNNTAGKYTIYKNQDRQERITFFYKLKDARQFCENYNFSERDCKNCKHEKHCTKTIGILAGFCNTDFEVKQGIM